MNAAEERAALEQDVLSFFEDHSWDETANHFERSRGFIYHIVKKHNALKNGMRRSLKDKRDLATLQAQVFQDVLNQVTEADVHDWLDMLPDGCGNLALFSPPYNRGINYELDGDNRPFAEYKYDLALMLAKLYRKLTPNGAIALQVGTTVTDTGLTPLDEVFTPVLREVGFHVINRIILTSNMGLHARNKLSHRHEVLIWAVKDPNNYVFNLNAIRVLQKHPGKKAFKGPKKGQLSGNPLGANPGDVWSGELTHKHNNSAEGKQKAFHPCPYKAELARRVVLMATNPGDLVLAPYSGSGTTESQAKATGRLWAGCDISYTDEARALIDATEQEQVHWLTGIPDAEKLDLAQKHANQLAML